MLGMKGREAADTYSKKSAGISALTCLMTDASHMGRMLWGSVLLCVGKVPPPLEQT